MGCHPNITNTEFPRQGAFLGRRVQVVFHYGAETVLGVVVRDDSEAPGETIIRLDNGRFVRSVECQWNPDRSAEEAGATRDATEERLDELLADRDWDDCDKGDAYDVLSEIQAQRDEARIRVGELETALATLLDAAERQAAGFPLPAEEWFAVRDYARARLPEKRAASAEPLNHAANCTIHDGPLCSCDKSDREVSHG